MTGWRPPASQAETRPAEALGDDTARSIVRAVAVAVGDAGRERPSPGHPDDSAGARAVLKDLTRADLPRLVVLSQREIPRDTPVEVLGSVVEEEPPVVTIGHHVARRGRTEIGNHCSDRTPDAQSSVESRPG